MAGCCVIGFDCPEADLCTRCKGTGEEPEADLCCHCDHCFDEVIGWNTGIEPGTPSTEATRVYVLASKGGVE